LAEENKLKVMVKMYYYEFWNKGDISVADEIFSENCIRHYPRSGNPLPDLKGRRK
jgi:hypothetical protein